MEGMLHEKQMLLDSLMRESVKVKYECGGSCGTSSASCTGSKSSFGLRMGSAGLDGMKDRGRRQVGDAAHVAMMRAMESVLPNDPRFAFTEM